MAPSWDGLGPTCRTIVATERGEPTPPPPPPVRARARGPGPGHGQLPLPLPLPTPTLGPPRTHTPARRRPRTPPAPMTIPPWNPQRLDGRPVHTITPIEGVL
ncbi:hypothetical protein GCM10027160_23900 [Streptomyces calidiresistens]